MGELHPGRDRVPQADRGIAGRGIEEDGPEQGLVAEVQGRNPAAACGDDPVTMDDAGTALELAPAAAYVEMGEEFVPTTLDFSCMGTSVEPTPGEIVDVTFELRDFQDDFEVTEQDVWVFPGNEIGDTCDAPACQLVTTDASGNATVQLPTNGWYAYRVLPKMGATRGTTVFGVFQYNEPAPPGAGGSVMGQSVSGSTIEVIPALLGISREPGLAIVAGRLQDCNESFVENGIVRLFDPDGNFVEQGTLTSEPGYHYFNGNPDSNLPNQEETDSNVDGLYVVVQVPVVDERPYRVEMWANINGTTERVGCEAARIFPDAVTILNLSPMRADAPASCL